MSVDQTLLLGIVPNIQENYDNCAVIFKSIELRNIQFTLSADLKLLNLILGLQNHTSKYSCCFCNKSSDCVDWLFAAGDKQTFESIRQQNLAWKQRCNSDLLLKDFIIARISYFCLEMMKLKLWKYAIYPNFISIQEQLIFCGIT